MSIHSRCVCVVLPTCLVGASSVSIVFAVCANVTVGAVTTHPRSPACTEDSRKRRQTAGLRLRQNCATPADHWKIGIHHGSCLPGAMSQKGRRQQKEWKCGECQRWTWSGSKCWYCGSYGSMEQKGRILGDAASLESASKEDITATLRHHKSLLKSMNGGAPVATRGAIASRIEILKQAMYAKEPFHVSSSRCRAALTRAEEVAEKKHSAVWTAREAADKADQHVLNLRQRMAELTERIYTDTDTGMNEEPWSCGEWQDAGGSWSG